jgi:predicted site-specific integrase-resolvase
MVIYKVSADIKTVMAIKRKKLAEFAREQGVAYITAYRHWQLGNIEGTQLPTGSILVSDWIDKSSINKEALNAIIYSRVTSSNKKQRLKEQTSSLTAFAEEKGYTIVDIVEEVAPGFSDHRTKLLSVLYRNDWNVLLIEDRNTFMKFSFPYIEALLRKNHQEIISLSDFVETEGADELTSVPLSGEQELINLITKTRGVLKTLIGMGSTKQSIETPINSLLD